MAELDVGSRFNTDGSFIAELHAEGRRRADAWLELRETGANHRGIRGVGRLNAVSRGGTGLA